MIPQPSRLRTFVLDAGGAQAGQGLLGPNAVPRWAPQNPLDRLWSWIDATTWCEAIGDVIGQIGWQVVGGDGLLAVLQSAILRDPPHGALIAGLRLQGGTPGTRYLLRIRLTGLATGEQRTTDIQLPICAAGPVVPLDPAEATINRDGLRVGSKTLFVR